MFLLTLPSFTLKVTRYSSLIQIGYPIYNMWFETNFGETGFKDLRIYTQYTQQENNENHLQPV